MAVVEEAHAEHRRGVAAPFSYSEAFLPLEISIFLGAVAELCMHGRTALGRGRGACRTRAAAGACCPRA